jgi:hypothetical protein
MVKSHLFEKNGSEEELVPKKDGKKSSWSRVEEYRINKPSQQLKQKKKKKKKKTLGLILLMATAN